MRHGLFCCKLAIKGGMRRTKKNEYIKATQWCQVILTKRHKVKSSLGTENDAHLVVLVSSGTGVWPHTF